MCVHIPTHMVFVHGIEDALHLGPRANALRRAEERNNGDWQLVWRWPEKEMPSKEQKKAKRRRKKPKQKRTCGAERGEGFDEGRTTADQTVARNNFVRSR